MAEQTSNEQSIFLAALEKPTAADRAAFLDEACAGNVEMRSQVDALLAAHDRLPTPAFSSAVDPAHPTYVRPPGTVIGRYKLLEPIGEGGYGTVFMAEQTSPVQRRVALKIIKAGMDTRQVIARFEAERQALALMDHPNIAKVFDAGVTDTGRPYFVMELVKGAPITKYCDEHHLPPRARLELFIHVCQAVQHAHQKGIIHRDLKPSNVLVALYDGKPVPKVIDFGVAKATGQRLTDATMFTGFGDVIGTPQYMSPEQAELNQLDVDTRSDIYSLGVLLYELLTGTTPLENERIKRVALLEVLRFIREEEPPKPSTRLSTAEQLPSIAANRGLEPKKLSGLLKGELDWIVMRALEKDRTRRYETANGVATDVQRYLNDEAVQACPPSARYRARKFARHHKVVITTGVIVFLSLATGLGVATAGWARARRDREQAREALSLAERRRITAEASEQRARLVDDFMSSALTSARVDWRANQALTVRELVDRAAKGLASGRFASDPVLRAEARLNIGRTYESLGVDDLADRHLNQALDQLRRLHGERDPSVVSALIALASLKHRQGFVTEAESRLREAMELATHLETNRDAVRKEIQLRLDSVLQQPGADAFYMRGLMHGRRGHFARAAADWARATELKPSDWYYWNERVCLTGYLNEGRAYAELSKIALAKCGANSGALGNLEIAKACALLPYDGQDLPRLRTIAERAIVVSPAITATELPWSELSLGVVYYRLRDYEVALDHIGRARELIHHEEAEVSLDFLRAMTLHRLGRQSEARATYAKVVMYFDQHVAKVGADDLNDGGFSNWLICQIVRREADALLKSADQESGTKAVTN